jgi:two-component system sensor histidine kinase CpxA
MNLAIGLLRQRGGEDPEAMLARLETEAERLNRLIGDLLLLSRLESGEAGPRALAVDLGELAEEIAADADFEAGARGCEVRLERRSTAVVPGVADLLRSAIENVVRNAVRHTAEGTTVEIDVSAEGRWAVVVVRDRGPGVPDDQREQIFEPFRKVEGTGTVAAAPAADGTGLGLAIARRAIVQHGGMIEAMPAADGGLQVVIRVPRAA